VLTLRDPLDHARRVHPRRIAVVDGDTRLDYAQLHRRCLRLAAALETLGVRAGDRVAILCANGHAYLEAFFGVPSGAMVLVPLNTRLAEAELVAILRDCQPRVLLTDRDPGRLRDCVDRVVSIPDDYEKLLSAPEERGEPRVDEASVAALLYTGGTTGRPKGVMLTHRNFVANAFHKTVACSLTMDDVFLAAPAMFHVAGLAPLVGLAWLGATVVTCPAFDAGRCLDLVEEHGVTVIMPVPTMLAALVAAQRTRRRDVVSLRMLGHAGSPIANAAIEAAHEVFPSVELAQFYGATETCSIVTCLRDEQAAIGTPRLGSCGCAVPGVSVKVVRNDGGDAEPGEVGEVHVRGPNVSPGYWGDATATSVAFVDGWYRTGDLGVLAAEGLLFVVDRLKDMIVSGGENVYSIEVEDALGRHPAVVEAAVFGIPDPVWGEAVHAMVVVDRDAARGDLASELREHCRKFIAGYKVPKQIDVHVDPLPKSGPGKVLKRVLRAPFWREADASVSSGPRGT
jgi:acyl-CoA synthetase (AMP-forming)/AMP-acid ligase II